MNDFVYWDDWWTEKYRFQIGEGVRYPSMKIALNLFNQRNGEIMVETGTTRAVNDFGGAGMATIFLGDYCKKYNKTLYTVDILQEAISLSKKLTSDFADNINYIVADSLEFLEHFDQKIDLLYLDSYDYPLDEEEFAVKASQEHQAKELLTAWDKLSKDAIIVLDDNAWAGGGKCKLTKRMLVERGKTCVWDDFQSVWI